VCILPPSPPPGTAAAPARSLTPDQRQQLALDALTQQQPITELARQHHVSRKFVYLQANQAQQALDHAFDPPPGQEAVLFYLPVTRSFLRQLVLGLLLIGHSSFRGVVELLRDLFDYSISIGTIFNIVRAAVPAARRHNDQPPLAAVRTGAHDEIFQARQPVLVGADVESTYCYLLSQEEHRDAETWAVRLLELAQRGFHPEATIADGGTGLRAGQEWALPDIPCRGDVFHALHEVGPLVARLESRAYAAIAARSQLEHQQAQHRWHTGQGDLGLAQKVRHARPAEEQAIALAEDVALLARWLREDILTVAGPDADCRRELYDFVVAELRAREPECPKQIRPARVLLQNQRDDLLAFVVALDQQVAVLAKHFAVCPALVRDLLNVQTLDGRDPRRWQREALLRQRLGGRRYVLLRQAVAAMRSQVVRASSVIENLNSRLRNYFFLRRQVGPDYLALLQFFLNHRRFLRSEHPQRQGRSPAELLTGQSHPHWLELLGYERFSRN
jgi:hypothetical protein